MVTNYMGTTGGHGGGHWFSSLLQVPTARSNTQTGSSRRSLPTVLQPGCSLPQLPCLEMEPSHLTLHCVVHIKHRLSENFSQPSKECFTHTTAPYLCPAGHPNYLEILGLGSSWLALSPELLGMFLNVEEALFPSSQETLAGI